MANLDSSFPHKFAGATLVISDGAGSPASVTVTFKQGTISWTETGRTYTEAREAGRHASVSGKPVLIETDDTDVTGSFTALVTSFKGSSNTHPYEALTFSGNASAWTSTAGGSKTAIKLVLTVDSSGEDSTGGSQTVTFAYAVPTEVSVDAACGDGLFQLSCSFTDHENRPTLA